MARTRLPILILNAGSSSLKFAVHAADGDEPLAVLRGQASGIGMRPILSAQAADGSTLRIDVGKIPGPKADHAQALASVLAHLPEWTEDFGLAAVGHRVVHGGAEFTKPVRLTPVVVDRLAALEPLAPHHQPHNIAAIRAVAAMVPGVPQVACFDTAFHADQPAVARRLGLSRKYEEGGLRRYGFHGLSYEYVTDSFPRATGRPLPERTIIAHLGNGCSLAAVRRGRGIATSMGFSTLDGVPMATRSGAVDPGALLYLMREKGFGYEDLHDLLYNRSGLLGASGISADMKTLLDSQDSAAAEAVEFFCYRVAREVGALAMALGGLDSLVFTGGIGEKAAPVRDAICRATAWLGLALDDDANMRGATCISQANSPVSAWIIPTNEETVIARHTLALIGESGRADGRGRD